MIGVESYRQKLIKQFGFASPILMQEYADVRKEWKELERRRVIADEHEKNGDVFKKPCKGCKKK